jgi:hypothetical protein
LGETDFDMQGYYIKDGFVNFKYNKDTKLLQLEDIYTKSKMIDFKGNGNINLKTKQIGINMDVVFMKDHSKFLNHIPVVGYIVTGDDGNFITQVDINGTIDEPNFETHTIENASTGAVNMIKRTIGLPFKILNDIFDTNTTTIEDEKRHKKVVEELFGK